MLYLAALSSCSGGESATTQPLVTQVLAPQIQLGSGAMKQVIGPEGGSITTTDAPGHRYALTLSPGWKAESTEVAITALAAIGNLPVGSTLLAGATMP
jgi:hypothetical protein